MSRPNGASVHRTLVAVCSTVVLVSGFAAGLHGQPAKAPVAIVDPATGSRALLYVDVVGTGANRRLVTAGVLPEGRQLGAVVFGLGAAWSPDGTGFAFIDHQLALKFRDRAGQETVLFQGDPNEQLYPWQPAWSPDGKQIAVLTVVPGAAAPLKMSIALVDVSARKVQSRFAIPRGVTNIPSYSTPPNKFRWSADGRKILLSWESAAVLDTKTGAFELLPGGPILAEWAPAGDSVYYLDVINRGQPPGPALAGLYRTKLGSGMPPAKLLGPQELAALGLTVSGKIVLGAMTLSPGGTKLAVGLGSGAGGAGKLLVYALGAPPDGLVPDKPLATFQTEELIAAIEWAPDETQLAVVAVAKDGVKIRAVNLATGVWRTLATLGPLDLNGREADVLAFKPLSWTQ